MAVGLHDIGPRCVQAGANARQAAVFNQQVSHVITATGRVDNPALADQDMGAVTVSAGHGHLLLLPCFLWRRPEHCCRYPGR